MKLISYGIRNVVLQNTHMDQYMLYGKLNQALAPHDPKIRYYQGKPSNYVSIYDQDGKTLVILDMDAYNNSILNDKSFMFNNLAYPNLNFTIKDLIPDYDVINEGNIENWSLHSIIFGLVIDQIFLLRIS